MTREEAIERIQDFTNRFKKDSNTYKALEMAIKALTQEPCDDVVLRKSIIEILTKYNLEMSKIAEDVNELPPVTQKSGKWIRHDNGKYHWFLCSCCDAMAGSDEKRIAYRFCPNCGARMESEE